MKRTLFALLLTAATIEPARADEPDFQDFASFRLPIFDRLAEEVSQPEKPKSAEPKSSDIDVTTYANRSLEAYAKALGDGKYTVLLFRTTSCVLCDQLVAKLDDPAFGKYADQVVVSVTNFEVDEGARHFAKEVQLESVPTMVILRTYEKRFEVVGRVEGVNEAEAIAGVMDEVMMRYPIERDPIDTRTYWNNFEAGFKDAMKRNLHLLVLFTSDDNEATRRMVAKLKSEELARHARKIVCVVTNPQDDLQAQKGIAALNEESKIEIQGLPALVLMRLHRDDVDVNGGVLTGEPEIEEIDRLLARSLENPGKRIVVESQPAE